VDAHVITDITWQTATPAAIEYTNVITAQVTVQQVFTSKPAGTSRGHYGYLFVRATYSDGADEEVLIEDTVPVVTTTNLFLTKPGDNDAHANSESLKMYNGATNQYMVTLAKTAVSECVESSVRVDFVRCDHTIGSGYPKVNVVMPGPTGIAFNISTNLGSLDLTPTNDGASYTPFLNSHTTPTSEFKLTVFFDDGSSVDTFANEPDSESATILYYSDDETCATVDNAQNTLTVVEGTACTEVLIHVNVTVGNYHFQGRDIATIVLLKELRTTAKTYPGGTGHQYTNAYLLPLPCNTLVFEKYELVTYGTLSTGHTSQIGHNSIVSYASSNTASSVREGTNLVTDGGGSGTAEYGGTANEFAFGWNTGGVAWNHAGVTLSPFTITVSRAYVGSNYDYAASQWNGVPGGTSTSSSMDAALSTLTLLKESTLHKEQGQTQGTTFSLVYTRNDPVNSDVQFRFDNLASHAGWISPNTIITYSSLTPTVIDVDVDGQLTLKQNYHNPVKLEAFICAADTTRHLYSGNAKTATYLWANLAAGPEDVDVGTVIQGASMSQYAPFYFPTATGGLSFRVCARPKAGKYLRSVELQIVLPVMNNLNSNDFEWNSEDASWAPGKK